MLQEGFKPKFKKVRVKSVEPAGVSEVFDVVEPMHKLFITNRILTEDTINFGIN